MRTHPEELLVLLPIDHLLLGIGFIRSAEDTSAHYNVGTGTEGLANVAGCAATAVTNAVGIHLVTGIGALHNGAELRATNACLEAGQALLPGANSNTDRIGTGVDYVLAHVGCDYHSRRNESVGKQLPNFLHPVNQLGAIAIGHVNVDAKYRSCAFIQPAKLSLYKIPENGSGFLDSNAREHVLAVGSRPNTIRLLHLKEVEVQVPQILKGDVLFQGAEEPGPCKQLRHLGGCNWPHVGAHHGDATEGPATTAFLRGLLGELVFPEDVDLVAGVEGRPARHDEHVVEVKLLFLYDSHVCLPPPSITEASRGCCHCSRRCPGPLRGACPASWCT